jgi:RND superfamily putative drug exporter
MGSVFAGFIVDGDAIVTSIGFALATGILFDAFLVRMTLVPALMSLLGARAWWLPRWLDRCYRTSTSKARYSNANASSE